MAPGHLDLSYVLCVKTHGVRESPDSYVLEKLAACCWWGSWTRAATLLRALCHPGELPACPAHVATLARAPGLLQGEKIPLAIQHILARQSPWEG